MPTPEEERRAEEARLEVWAQTVKRSREWLDGRRKGRGRVRILPNTWTSAAPPPAPPDEGR